MSTVARKVILWLFASVLLGCGPKQEAESPTVDPGLEAPGQSQEAPPNPPAHEEEEADPPSPPPATFESEPKPSRGGAFLDGGSVGSSSALGFLPPQRQAGELRVHFFDIGQGDTTFIECPNGNVIVVDSGSVKGGGPKAVEAEKYLDSLVGDDGDIHSLVITHPDQDHYNQLAVVIDASHEVQQVFMVGE